MLPLIQRGVRDFVGGWSNAAIDWDFFRKCREAKLWPHQVGWARYGYELEYVREQWLSHVSAFLDVLFDFQEEQEYGNVMRTDQDSQCNVQISLPRRRFLLDTVATDYLFIRIKGFDKVQLLVRISSEEKEFEKLTLKELHNILVAIQWRPW